ncbi:GNAT family N-acetyltransferase [Saccharopolyspora rhizosphaerae]|uniref:GNAT family N-acetyltransferase n=1 Tax=Saccharopolyspora rhizosphaerae TaxID=2492662 RepID=A0A426JXY9_9PSEU|nr:GNAT family N-acetyltransferase [Saccharopolyspora rhizosphaerae]RRO18055.1 GNAT family N-acetyltransferase [Saccharopolyspora rhizosphaerae]
MGESDVRVLSPAEHRQADELFRRAIFLPPADEDTWAATAQRVEAGRVLGAFVDDEVVGTALSMTSALTVPGGAELPAAAVTGVAVRADSTRRGLLTGMMRYQLDDAARRGEAVAVLHASEAGIYERFGYGVATRTRSVELQRAHMRSSVPRSGRVRLVTQERARDLLPAIYRRCRTGRAGRVHRPDGWWPGRDVAMGESRTIAVHSDDEGADDGFVVYQPRGHSSTVDVRDLVAANDLAAGELWRFLVDLDLITTLAAFDRPVDEPLEWLLADRRTCRTTSVEDDLWVRLVDVPVALRARTYGPGDPVVVEVVDDVLPANSGRYRISSAGVTTCDDSAQLTMSAAALAALYLGDQPASALAAAGLVEAHTANALTSADHLFATARPPWCGTNF